jgi:hypothetical protein
MEKTSVNQQARSFSRRSKRGTGSESALLAVLIGMLGLMLPHVAFARQVQSASLTVLVYNYRQIPHHLLARAEEEAGKILGKSGLQTRWLDCFPISGLSDRCTKSWDRGTVRLRVVAGHLRNHYLGTISGLAILPALASVYYDHLPSLPLGDTSRSDLAVVLGCVMAHEIGHLLLGSYGHSVGGIMRGSWTYEQIRLALMGCLNFSAEESRLMREGLLARRERWKEDPDSSAYTDTAVVSDEDKIGH